MANSEIKTKAEAVLNCVQKLENFIDASEFIPAIRSHRGIVILALFSKALTVGRAVCTLVTAGFHEEAFGLTRTLMDIYFIVRYISNDNPEKRATRFAEFFAKNHEDWVKIISKYFSHLKIKPTDINNEYLATAKNYKNPNEWSGEPQKTKSLAMEPSTYEFDANGAGTKAEFDYEVLYKWTSHYVHSTVSGLQSHFTNAGDIFKIRPQAQEIERGTDALFNVLAFSSKIFISGFQGLRQEQPAILNEIHNEMLSIAK